MNILKHIKKPTPEQLLQWAGIGLSIAGMVIDKKVKTNEHNAAMDKMKDEVVEEVLKDLQNKNS